MKKEDVEKLLKKINDTLSIDLVFLREENLRSLDEDQWAAFGDILQNKNVITLNLQYNALDDKSIIALAEALEKNTTLTTLNVRYNEIGADGAHALAKALEKNTTLTTLDVSSNKIGADGIDALLKALDSNYTLLEIKISGMSEEQAALLSSRLKRNQTYSDKEKRVTYSLLTTKTYEEAEDIRFFYHTDNNPSVFFGKAPEKKRTELDAIEENKGISQEEKKTERKNN